jgi:hypothetical protein
MEAMGHLAKAVSKGHARSASASESASPVKCRTAWLSTGIRYAAKNLLAHKVYFMHSAHNMDGTCW